MASRSATRRSRSRMPPSRPPSSGSCAASRALRSTTRRRCQAREARVSLAEVPVILVLIGLAAYTVLGGADFGAGFWQLTPGSGKRARAIRAHAHHVIGPVWEANHVWLIFVLVVCWTAYPRAFGAITTTLAVPLFIAGIGIVLRGTLYALHTVAEPHEARRVEISFALSSILTPFALGTVVGGIVAGRVPV